jgi:dGTPase
MATRRAHPPRPVPFLRGRAAPAPAADQERIEREGLHRVVCDYIAGMTDRFALDEHRKLFDPLVRV